MVLRRSWRAIAAVLLVTMVVPALPVSGLIADGVAAGTAISPHGKGSPGLLVVTVLLAPGLLVVAAGCGLVVARGWNGAVWAAASAGSGRAASLGEALRWIGRRSRLPAGSYLAGLAALVGVAFIAGYAAPAAPTVPDVLVLAGPAGLLAPVLGFASAVALRRRAPAAGEPPEADAAPARTRRPAYLAPMALVLTVVVSCEVAAALGLSWLMTSPYGTGVGLDGINGPAAVVIASVLALPGSVLLAAATSLFVFGRVARV